MMHIATHPGTGTHIVDRVLRERHTVLHTVTNRNQAHDIDFDGVILLGGADISPYLYGSRNHYCNSTNIDRDRIEWVLVRRAMDEDKPIFGICRGHQMLAVAHGGSLVQDILAERRVRHPGWHSVSVKRPLSQHIPDDHMVNSYHHQAIRSIPTGFSVVAQSPDGTVEAIWRPGVLGVQWHPELLIGDGQQEWTSLFNWFLAGLT